MPEDLVLSVVLPPDQFEALARRVADVLEEGRDDGFLDASGAAEYLGLTTRTPARLDARSAASDCDRLVAGLVALHWMPPQPLLTNSLTNPTPQTTADGDKRPS